MNVGQMVYQPVSGDLCTNLLVVICGPGKKNCMDAMITTTMTTADDIRAMEVPFVS